MFANWCALARNKYLKFPKFSSFQFWPLCKNRKLGKLGNFFKTCSCFDPYTKIESSENSKINWRLVAALLEEVGNFRGFRVFDFGPYKKIENSENSEIVSRLVKLIHFFVCLGKLESSEIWEFSILTLMLKSKTRKTFQNIFKACKVKWIRSV